MHKNIGRKNKRLNYRHQISNSKRDYEFMLNLVSTEYEK